MIQNSEESHALILKEIKKYYPNCDAPSYLESLSNKRQEFENDPQAMLIHTAFKDIGGNLDRLHILHHLGQKTCSVNELADEFEKSQPTISRNVKLLEKSQLLKAHKDGKYTFYRPNKLIFQKITHFFQTWIQTLSNNTE